MRDWRSGELRTLVAALITAVTIVTGLSLFTDKMQQSLNARSNDFLAADRVIQGATPLDEFVLEEARRRGLRDGLVLTFQSVVYATTDIDSAMQMATVKAVSDSYPLRGTLDVSDQPFATSYKSNDAPKVGEVWVDARLLPLMQLSVGDKLYVGEAALQITRVVVNEPDRGAGFGVGLRVLMNEADIAATQIVQPGSRVSYRYLLAGQSNALIAYEKWLTQRLPATHKWRSLKDAQPQVSRSLQRAEQFLLLAGVLGVGLAGVAIALAARRYSERHYDYVAMMKALGASSSRILRIYAGNFLLLAVLAFVVGCALAWLFQEAIFYQLRDSVTVTSQQLVTARPFILGGTTALICLLSFALPPLIHLQKISPLRVLRKDVGDGTRSNAFSVLAGVLGTVFLMYWYSGNAVLTLAVLAGISAVFVIAALVAWLFLRGTTQLGMQAGGRWRLALASLRRRGRQNTAQAVMFSLSIMLLLIIALVRTSLLEEWRLQLPEGTPNHFLLNIAADEAVQVETLLQGHGLQATAVVPMVVGRLLAVNDEPMAKRVKRLQLKRSFDNDWRMTWSQSLPQANEIIEGQWWSADSDSKELSLEQEMAERMQVGVGDTLKFAIGGQQLSVKVTSLRALDWQSMKPNFFTVFSPHALKEFPATYLSSFYLPSKDKVFLNEFLRAHPTITVIEMDAVMRQMRSIIDQVGAAIELVLALIVFSGVLVLLASVQASLDTRFQESAILRTLGAKRGLVLGSLAIEFAVLGALAGSLAALGAESTVYFLQENMMDMSFSLHPWVWLGGPIIGAMLIGFVGYISCRTVVTSSPVVVLREL